MLLSNLGCFWVDKMDSIQRRSKASFRGKKKRQCNALSKSHITRQTFLGKFVVTKNRFHTLRLYSDVYYMRDEANKINLIPLFQEKISLHKMIIPIRSSLTELEFPEVNNILKYILVLLKANFLVL